VKEIKEIQANLVNLVKENKYYHEKAISLYEGYPIELDDSF